VSGFESSQTFEDPLFRTDTTTDEAGNTISTNYRLNSVTTTQSFNGGTVLAQREMEKRRSPLV